MNHLLAGFTDELIKLGAPGLSKVPSISAMETPKLKTRTQGIRHAITHYKQKIQHHRGAIERRTKKIRAIDANQRKWKTPAPVPSATRTTGALVGGVAAAAGVPAGRLNAPKPPNY